MFGKIAPVTARNHLLSDQAAQQVLVTLHFLVLVNLLKAIAIADTIVALIQQVNCQSSCLWSDIGSSLKSQWVCEINQPAHEKSLSFCEKKKNGIIELNNLYKSVQPKVLWLLEHYFYCDYLFVNFNLTSSIK